jgi:hypothetical protein
MQTVKAREMFLSPGRRCTRVRSCGFSRKWRRLRREMIMGDRVDGGTFTACTFLLLVDDYVSYSNFCTS